jgi:hypothetical protein
MLELSRYPLEGFSRALRRASEPRDSGWRENTRIE